MSLITDLPPSNPALILINAEAGGKKVMGAALQQMLSLTASGHWPLEFRETRSAEELKRHAKIAVRAGCRVMLAMGGDGTFQSLINAAIGADVILGVIPTGGGNDFAASIGLPRNPLLALQKIVHGETRRVDLALAKTADGRERHYAGGGGLGLDSIAAHHASNEYRRVPGRVRYVMAALHSLKKFKSINVSAEFPDGDHRNMRRKVLLASVLNTPTYGGGVRLAPDARTSDGLLDVVLLEDLKALEIAGILPRLLTSGELRTPRVTRLKTTRVRLTADCQCLFHGDGELIGPAPVEIAVVPGAIQILAPKQD